MERDIIERLAMDHALGELDTDTAVLFEAYLAEHGEVRHWAQAMTETCTQTRKAISQKTQPIDAKRHVPRLRGLWPDARAWQTWGRWAAVIFICLGLGIVAGRWSRPQVATPRTVVVQAESTSAPSGWRQVLSRPSQGFWESKAVAMLQTRSEEIPRAHTAQRNLWDRYRQPKKEWRYE